MKLTCFILLLIQGFTSFAQKTGKFYDYLWKLTDGPHARFYSVVERTDSGYHRLDYYVHDGALQMDGWFEDSACKISSGKFTYLYPGKLLESSGRYLHNKKQGLWLTYHPNGMIADSTVYDNGMPSGTSMAWYSNGIPSDSSVYNADGSGIKVGWFDNGNPSYAGRLAPGYKHYGKWQFFHRNGKTSAFELYTHDSLLDKQYFDETGQPVLDTTNKDTDANFPGSTKGWLKYLGNHLDFPENYKITNSDEAVVVITMTIDEDGQVKDAYVSTPFYPPFEEIALRVITHSPKWKPAIKHNRRVSTVFRQPVVFSQPD
jgi:Gram-negative bacterial TonB protein C-terminal